MNVGRIHRSVSRLARATRRRGPEIMLALTVVLAGVSVWQAWAVVQHLREQARTSSRIYGKVTAALGATDTGVELETLLALVTEIRATGIPLVVTDAEGRIAAVENTPYDDRPEAAELPAYVRALDRSHPPIPLPDGATLHYGVLPAARRLTWLSVLQLALLATLVVVGVWAYRTAVGRDRSRLWVAMARESAHQLGTPLMSATAWVERLEAGTTPPEQVAAQLRGDLERLQRVAERFERIGRPARQDRVALGALAERVATYFRARLPKHAHHVTIQVEAPSAGPTIAGDATLVEWALEALVRNAVDALSGRGGTIRVQVEELSSHGIVRVQDDGPGVPPELAGSLFEPGVTTKAGGWGIGLALARRIVEDVHGGRLVLEAARHGASFRMELPKRAVAGDD